MAQSSSKRGSLADRLHAAERELDRVCRRMDDQIERVARVAAILQTIAVELEENGDLDAAAVRRTQMERRVLREEAAVGALSVEMKQSIDGSAVVQIDGGKAFRLQPKLATLLGLLRRPGAAGSADDLIAWHSYEDVATALGKDASAPQTRHAVAQAIYKLRAALRDAGQNWFFVQTDRCGRVRFALRSDRVGE